MKNINVLITSGGTVEKIDAVRGITNFSTGKLGSLLAESFSMYNAEIWYMHAKTSCMPSCDVKSFPFESVVELKQTIETILRSEQIDVIVHAAAVSDYMVAEVMDSRGNSIDNKRKISSSESELTVKLTQTPKIISELRELAQNAVIVGFKLLDGVTKEVLYTAAKRVMDQNRCDFVLMNDSAEISGECHVGYLLNNNGIMQCFETKCEIASGIAKAVWEELDNG